MIDLKLILLCMFFKLRNGVFFLFFKLRQKKLALVIEN